MIVLAIESSCDEFSMAIIKNGVEVLFMETFTQIQTHAKYGGVVPELASREHVRYFSYVVEKVKCFLDAQELVPQAVAVTVGPGLSGSLLVGINAGKTIASILGVPLIPVHHILGHIFSANLSEEVTFPILSLVVSGGHTELIISKTYTNHVVIGKTRDDAVGEVYDKIAKQLSLPYPGGPIIDKMAQQGERTYIFKKPKMDERYAFSFSGLKSAVVNEIRKGMLTESDKINLAHSFQKTVIDELSNKLIQAVEEFNVKTVVLCGGVSANSQLRQRFVEISADYKSLKYLIPKIEYCGDNAAMIGAIANYLPPLSISKQNLIDCSPNLTIAEFFKKYNEVKE
ncbi:MAG: tRNA (adenosine(37)-N6)-threonylcarbamoyltransferase complex transferase subunit TsaD [Culicoidibacterales bacterium]